MGPLSREGYIIDFERLGPEGTIGGTANAGEGPGKVSPPMDDHLMS